MPELTLKISVDAADLDKVEAQLKRINDLLVGTGMKKPESVGFTADKFFIANGQVFIDAPFITSATINSAKIKDTAIGSALRQAAEEGARKGAEQALFKITTDTNDKPEQQSAEVALNFESGDAKFSGILYVDKLQAPAAGVLANTQETAELIEKSQSEYEETKQQLDKRFNEIQSQITSTQCALASGVDALSARISNLDVRTDNIESAIATSVRTLREEIVRARSGW
ncbi:phage tail tip fiber protein [Providencia manganoxydans]|uniref:phage tail tip fiber protein n=1 Tax=Providencia manganoxydans TaxID=2923283 RepID=UPI0032DB279F